MLLHPNSVLDNSLNPSSLISYAAENLATLRRLALNTLRKEKTKKRSIRGKQLNASWDHAYLLRLLGI